jgi:uncharacterized Zn-binding protein involved in type VI secretion
MGKPAARLGDTTAHGGTIMAGAPTVLIGGMPAARMGDMHVCPLLNPGVPPPPHVGQPITLGCPTVLICGQMAARMGDMAACAGPPDSIVAGCPTVLIGEGGGGGGGAGPGGAAASAAMAGGGTREEGDEHYLDVKFADKAGKPIRGVKYLLKDPQGQICQGLLQGQLLKKGVDQGNYEISLIGIEKAEWSKPSARDGETVKLLVEAVGFDSGTKVEFEIWERNSNKADRPVQVIDNIPLQNDKAETSWQFVWSDKQLNAVGGYSTPAFYFIVNISGIVQRSNILDYKDYIELWLKDAEDNPVPNAKFRVFLSSGEIREGQLDSNGYKKIEKVPPGKWRAEFI